MKIPKCPPLIFIAGVALATVGFGGLRSRTETFGINSNDIARAINKDICFNYFWNGQRYNLGSVVWLHVVRQSDHVDAWSDELLRMRDPFITHFIIKANRGRIFVDYSESYNERTFPQMVARLRTPDQIKLAIAANCNPARAKESAKTRLIQKIAANELGSLDALSHRQRTKSIIIANVDDSYLRSFVYVPATDELFTVAVPPGTSYDYREDGPYLFGQIVDHGNVSAIRDKILKYGIMVAVN